MHMSAGSQAGQRVAPLVLEMMIIPGARSIARTGGGPLAKMI